MAGCRKQSGSGGKFQAWFTDAAGKQKFFMAAVTRRESLQMAEELEAEARKVRLGLKEPAHTWDREKLRPIREAIGLYLSWGKSQGGRGGRPWAPVHAKQKQTRLTWWVDALKLETLSDLGGDTLGRAERALQGLQSSGSAGKTLINYREALISFCEWMAARGMVERNPVERLGSFDKTPRTRRRLLTDEEVTRILGAAPPGRAVIYRLMLATGLRLGEVRRLRVDNLNPDMGAVCLDGSQTKNRKPATIFIPPWLMAELQEATAGKGPAEPLLKVPNHLLARFDGDCEKVKVVKSNPAGKVDLHALRVKYITTVVEGGANVREIMDAARHSSPDMSLGVYAKSRHERLREISDRAGDKVKPCPDYVTSMHRRAVGDEAEPETAREIGMLPAHEPQRAEGPLPPARRLFSATTLPGLSPPGFYFSPARR